MIENKELHNSTRTSLSLRDDALSACNDAPSRFWTYSRYKEEAVHTLCNEITHQWMFALVTFHGAGSISFSVSQKTWERGEGHFPVVMQLFGGVAKSPSLAHLQGSFIVWLEDGMWDWCQHYARRAPMLAFGRNVSDTTTFLIPDPAFIGAKGYAFERRQSERFASQVAWDRRHPTIFWRGAATGPGIEGPEWVDTARGRLVLAAKEIGDAQLVDAKLTRMRHLSPQQNFNLAREGVVHDEVPFETFFNFKYVVDADGYHCAWKSLFLKLMMGSVVLKIDSPLEQWYHRKLMPWRHYIPVSRDVKASELRELHQWLVAHDSEARAIAQEGGELISGVTFESAVQDIVKVVENVLNARA
ncbi:MAG: hypothetical protein RL518_2435 [Pseudomonadota bacterium]|jgi:hypothetical protein